MRILLLLGLLFSMKAHAGLLFEPYVGYETGEWEQTTNSADVKGANFGARLGASISGFTFGADYFGSATKHKTDFYEQNLNTTDIGAFAGYYSQVGFRIYASMFFISTANLHGQPENVEGSASRLGIGWALYKHIALNLELITRKYDEYETLGPLNPKVEFKSTGVSLSFPMP